MPGTPLENLSQVADCLKAMYEAQQITIEHWVVQGDGILFVQRSWVEKEKIDPNDDPPLNNSRGPKQEFTILEQKWPQALSKESDWVAWNAAVKTATETMASADGDGDGDVAATIDAITPQMVAVSIGGVVCYPDSGHCNGSSMQFNWMLKERRELRAQDVFRDGMGWARLIEARFRAELGEHYEDLFGEDKSTELLHEAAVNPANWQLNSKGLTVYDNNGSYGTANLPISVTIPWGALKRFLNPSFVVPR